MQCSRLSSCGACSTLAESFERGLERTSRYKLEGGDADWEERRQQTGYANSEVRFVEIEEQLCKDVERGKSQCHDNHQAWEEHLEEWWRTAKDVTPIRQWLCVDTLKVCCPEDHYGPKCKPCDVACSGNGRCAGAGTRKGNGKCVCNRGYAGDGCDSCDAGYYDSDAAEDKLFCSRCHHRCASTCTGGVPKDCVDCRDGYRLDPDHGCQDVDECAAGKAKCDADRYCVNTDGAFKCSACHRACDGCDGGGADACKKCANGYSPRDGFCVSDSKTNGKQQLDGRYLRYFSYVCMIAVALVLSRRSLLLAAIVGLGVGVYISFSESYVSLNERRRF
jgi:hypothetical protein